LKLLAKSKAFIVFQLQALKPSAVNAGSTWVQPAPPYQVIVPFDDVRQQRTGQASELERRRHCVVAQVEIESKV